MQLKSLAVRAGVLLAALAASVLGTAARADFPTGPIKLIVPYAAGGGTDGVARAFAEGMTRELKVPVIVDNRPGAGAVVGTQAAVSAPKDGYTMLMAVNGNMVMSPLLYNNLKFDPAKDLRVFALAVEAPTVAVVNANVPATTMREFEAYAKANQGKLFYATLGQGNVLHITTKVMETMMGVQMTGVPYKGSAPALAAMMGGEVQLYMDLASTSIPLIKSGKLKALAVPNDKRLEALPEVPTFAEAGYPNFHAASWMGLAVPTGTPDAVVRTLQAAAQRTIADARFRDASRSLGMVMLPTMDEKAIADYVTADRARWGELVKRYNIMVEQ